MNSDLSAGKSCSEFVGQDSGSNLHELKCCANGSAVEKRQTAGGNIRANHISDRSMQA
jgi:hypothetical protein